MNMRNVTCAGTQTSKVPPRVILRFVYFLFCEICDSSKYRLPLQFFSIFLQILQEFTNSEFLLSFTETISQCKPVSYMYTNSVTYTQPQTRKLQQACMAVGHQDDIRMRSHRLLRLDDNNSAASCQQACCKLIVKAFYSQA